MSSLNRVTVLGHLGADVGTRYLANGDAVVNFSIATSQRWKDKATGERREETEWHRIVMYRQLAEIAGEFLSKGDMVLVEGRLKTRKWTDHEGIERYTTEIVGDKLVMLGRRAAAEEPQASAPAVRPVQQPQPAVQQPASPSLADMEDDIPF